MFLWALTIITSLSRDDKNSAAVFSSYLQDEIGFLLDPARYLAYTLPEQNSPLTARRRFAAHRKG
jgi:hypothetical protein